MSLRQASGKRVCPASGVGGSGEPAGGDGEGLASDGLSRLPGGVPLGKG